MDVVLNDVNSKALFYLMLFSSSFFVLLVTVLSFTWVQQELKADREWERLHGRRPTKVQAPTTDPLDDREGALLLRELKNVSNLREGVTTVRRRKVTVNCLPVMSEQQIECVLKREGNCRDGSYVVSHGSALPMSGRWTLSVMSSGQVKHMVVHGLSNAAGSDDEGGGEITLEGSSEFFKDLVSLVKHYSESDHGLLPHALIKNMWSDDAFDYSTAILGSSSQQ